ncbi:hypothetical protein PYW07_017241 [Mythimna separata]|uniref:Uncharacterized protein n=1 Tax=Mythimna separata TaxID=271217 RepID=A0AAD8DXJ7_MYTSE|nr:hypothetical protein PYW07_017241 [Mythimna separata]
MIIWTFFMFSVSVVSSYNQSTLAHCLWHNNACVESCPEWMIQRTSNCSLTYWPAQRTCDHPEEMLVGTVCGFSSAAGLLAQPIIIREAATIGSTSLLVALCSVVGFFTFVTPILLHVITKKYVTQIHYDPATSTYTATTINFFLAKKKLDFKVEDVEVPDIPGAFTTMKAKGTPLFIEARHFSDPLHYAKMMGYDKPMDFKLGGGDSDSTSK